jgi:regulator of sigma E protease
MHSLFFFIVAIAILVVVHEFGHFWVARRCGVKVLTFSVGFGPVLWSRKAADGTEYAISAIPLGGFVKMLDEREAAVAPEELSYAFNRKPLLARVAIVLAGPLANLIFAFFCLLACIHDWYLRLQTSCGWYCDRLDCCPCGFANGR